VPKVSPKNKYSIDFIYISHRARRAHREKIRKIFHHGGTESTEE
jgi:hypothetical protein